MNDIPIYRAEADVPGLADKLKDGRSLSYCTLVTPLQSKALREQVIAAVMAANSGMNDYTLYPTKSILVSTVWNLNDDVFDRVEAWIARNTPVNKPDNIGHVEDQIVGHMTDSWAIDDDGNTIADNTVVSDLPCLYHLCNSSVIYRHWQNQEWVDKVDELIQQIEAGEKFVSMECLFPTFDYAVWPDGAATYHVVARDEESAWLTKHLRAYGGEGVYEDCKVGRLLRNFHFSGKGYVDKPANPASIIFANATQISEPPIHENPFNNNSGVYLSQRQLLAAQEDNNTNSEEKEMSAEFDILNTQLAETREALKAAQETNKTLETKLAEANVSQYETQIADLTSQVEAASKKSEEDEKKMKEAKSEVEELTSKVDELTTANNDLTEQLSKVEAEKTRASRVSTLVDGGIDKSAAEEKVEKFDNLDDEQFSVIADELVAAAKVQSTSDEETSTSEETETETEESNASETESEEETDESGEASAEETNLDNAETSDEVDGTAASEDDTSEVRQSLASWVSSRLGKSDSDEEDSTEE